MENRRHHFSPPHFTCGNSRLKFCKDCNFQTELTLIFKQHLQEHHTIKKEPDEDLPNEKKVIQKYICKKCTFVTHFVLKWLQHTASFLADQ
ncbi:hypothetical protein, partial [Klebsiella pneumoniae]